MSEALLTCDQVEEEVDSAALALVEHGWQLSEWLDTARTSHWMCDVTIRCRREPGLWQELSCHSSVLAAVSPVLRHALADLDHLLEPGDSPGVVIISELSMADLLPLFYSGQVSVATSSRAGEVWAGLAELGVEAGLEMRREAEQVEASTSVVTIMLGVEEEETEHDQLPATLSLPISLEPGPHTLQLQTELLCDLQSVTKMQPPDDIPRDEPFSCEFCDSKFMTEINLSTHVTDYHLEIKCKECGEILKGNNNLVKHTVTKHPLYPDLDSGESLQPTCDICKETFVTNQALKFHQYKHSGLKPYKCKICDAAFRTPSTLKSHLIQHLDCKHKCSICGLKCSTSGKLKIHMRTHTNEKPYQCSFCSSTFKQQSVLKVHEFTHTKKSNHKCDRCGMFFPTKGRLVSHRSKPVCVTRNRPNNAMRKMRKATDPPQLHILDELDNVYNSALDKVTYFVQSESVPSEEVKNLGGDYDQSLNYPHDSLVDNLESSDIPVLVDNLPVIIHTDIENRHLDPDNDDSVEKHEEMMFSL